MRRMAGFAVAALLFVAGGCGGDEPERGATVFAAASLTEAYTELRDRLDFPVTYSFGSSTALATQVEQGAPVDVIATADLAPLQELRDAGLIDPPATFAVNRLTILVRRGNPKNVRALPDLGRDDLVVVLADESVPAGKYATQVLQSAGVDVRPKSRELDVKAAVAKVVAGEADASIVYVTDALAARARADAVSVPDQLNVSARYGVAVVRNARNRAAANRFVAALDSAEGRSILREYGFEESR